VGTPHPEIDTAARRLSKGLLNHGNDLCEGLGVLNSKVGIKSYDPSQFALGLSRESNDCRLAHEHEHAAFIRAIHSVRN
jgi:hypothetical protein